jgi:hypothetical protein
MNIRCLLSLPIRYHPPMVDRTHLESLVAGMTLSELSAKTGCPLSSIVSFAMGSTSGQAARAASSSRVAKTDKPASNGKGRKSNGVNTRTSSGREAYDSAIQGIIEAARGPVGASAIRSKVGGTPQQARAALHRLIEAGTITYTGQARATKYMPS